jgi:hypothetical protein
VWRGPRGAQTAWLARNSRNDVNPAQSTIRFDLGGIGVFRVPSSSDRSGGRALLIVRILS